MDKTSLGDRMKEYENVERRYLVRRQPVIIRVDGVHFHTFTRGFERPYYLPFRECMWKTAQRIAENMMGCKLAYTQSDEITFLLTDDDTLETQPWFGKNLQKIVSVTASLATYFFNQIARDEYGQDEPLHKAVVDKIATFDARAFILPHAEVLNCFELRQQDCTRNAIEAAGQHYFSHGQLNGKSCNQIQEMLFSEKGINFNDYPSWYKRGVCAVKKPVEVAMQNGETILRPKWVIDQQIPIFHKEPEYIINLVYHE